MEDEFEEGVVSQPRISLPMSTADDENDELDDAPDIPQPRLSLDVLREDEEGDDSFYYPPPRLSVPLEDENITQKSVELPRRAVSEQPLSRLSRASFGSIRLSEYFDDASRFYDKSIEIPVDDEIAELERQNEDTIFRDESAFSVG